MLVHDKREEQITMENKVRKQNPARVYSKLREDYYRDRERMEEQGRQSPNYGIMPNPDGHATLTGESGETIEVFLRIKDKLIEEARFTADRCLFTKAVCSAATELVQGKTIDDTFKVDVNAIIDRLEGISEDHKHCVHLAAAAIQRALKNVIAMGKNDKYV